jgi:hypothetical protein
MKAALVVAAALAAFLSWVVSGYGRNAALSYRIGGVLGAAFFWPLIVVALFSIGRRFRTPRNRAVILLWVWGLIIVGQLSVINLRQRAAARWRPPAAPTAAVDAGNASRAPAAATTQGRGASATDTRASHAPVDDDFSRGSDERLIKQIETAQEDRYRAVVDAYARACELRPKDAVLALERLRFIERFAYSEDLTIQGAEEDREAAFAYLTQRFPTSPGAVLYRLQRAFGPEFDAEAARYARSVLSWPAAERANFFLLRAQRTNNEKQQLSLARQSFDAKPTVAAGLLLLEHLPKKPPSAETLRVLEHPVFGSAQAWEKIQVMNNLFEAGRSTRAMALYQELKTQAPAMVETSDVANRIAAAGHVDLARALLARLPVNKWTRASLLRERFHFEVEHGTGEQAAAAYRELRAAGLAADPLLRARFTLLRKDPFAGWSWQDLPALGLCGLLFIALLLAPAGVLLPVHYWSLLRARAGKPLASPESRWGLREVWLATAAVLCVEMAGVWLFQPEWMQSWWRKTGMAAVAIPALGDGALLAQQFTSWVGMGLVLALALWAAQAWGIVWRNAWSWGRTIEGVLAATLILRIALLGYTAIWPATVESELATFSPTTKQLCLALLNAGGPLGMIVAIAGLVPLLEELFFRGVLLEGLAKHIPFGWANALQALLFAAVHENLRVLPFFVFFGVMCGWLARRSESLLAPMLMHGLNNLTVCLVLMAANR